MNRHPTAAGLAVLLLSVLCLAADAPQSGGGPHVVVPLQLSAEGELAAARRLADQGRWDLALPMLQALMEASPQALVHDSGVYRPLARVVDALLSASPPQTLANYALLYEPAAHRLYEQGVRRRSAALLRQAALRYLHTPSGVRADGALAELLMDQGRFASALLALSDTDGLALTVQQEAPLAARRIICLARLGRRAGADRVLAALKAAGVKSLTVAGRQWAPADFADRAFAQLAPARPAPAAASGNPALPTVQPDVSAARCVALPGGVAPDSAVPALPAAQAIAAGQGISVMCNGAVYHVAGQPPALQWTARAPGWVLMAAAEGDDAEALTPYFIPSTSLSQWLTYDNRGLATLSSGAGRRPGAGRLYAVEFDPASLGFPESPWQATQDQLRLTNQLTCLDPASGRALWTLGGGLPLMGVGPNDFWFFTAPTFSDGRLYVLAAFEGTVEALCLDAATGRIIWRQAVGPFESRQELERYWPELFLSDAGQPSVGDGLAVFPTGQGVVCAFDALDGSVRWFSPYPRAEASINEVGHQLTVPAGPWAPRRPVLTGGLCLVTPSDSRSLLALSLRTGEVRWEASVDRAVALLGVAGGRAFVQTRRGLLCLDAATGKPAWRCALPAAPGVGALGRSTVYVPQADGVLPVDAATGRAGTLMPWPPGCRTFGNLSFCGDSLVAAAPGRLTVCPPAGRGGKPSAPDDASVRQDRELAALRHALAHPADGHAPALYLTLCREHGAERRSGTLASCSFWTTLAAAVRDACAHDPALRQAFDAADLGRWVPFPTPAVRRAAASAPPPALNGVPTGQQAWSVEGYAVLPAAGEGADDPLLAVYGGKLMRINPQGGKMLWSVDLPAQSVPAGRRRGIAMPARQYLGAGMPAYVRTPGGVMVALPAGFLSVEPGSGALRWQHPAGWGWAMGAVLTRVPSLELLERARHGLPLPPGRPERMEPTDSFAASGSVAARLFFRRGLQALDPASGRTLLDLRRPNPRQPTGERVAALGSGLAVLLQQPQRLLYYDLHGSAPLAEWRFRSAGVARSMVAAPGRLLYVADYDGVYRFDLARMALTGEWPVEGGVDAVLSADEKAVIVSTLDGRLTALSATDGTPLLEVAADGATPLWAARAGDALVVLEAAEVRGTVQLGAETHFAGKGFAVRALRMADGKELWRLAWPGKAPQIMAPPRRAGNLWLLRSTQSGYVRLAGVEAATGRQAFAVELKCGPAPGPASLLLRDGRVILGYDARLVALAVRGGVE